MGVIDLRSDTVTKPSSAMRTTMANAEVGDDVYGEDPTINRLESLAAEMLGKEASLFAPSGTQTNLLALLTHCERGDEYIVGQQAHTYKFEGGGAAVLGSIQPQPLDFEEDGTLLLDKVAQVIKPDDFHFANTRLLCLENTQAGKALPMEYLQNSAEFARDHQIKLHLDGARIFNAAVERNVSVEAIAKNFDSVSICLSKGLGAPVGSLLCGSKDQISKARRWRKMLGGGMRQAGILAAGCIYALENNIDRLAEDHDKAARLASGLNGIQQTNMVFLRVGKVGEELLPAFLKDRGILISAGETIRFVTHMDIRERDIDTVIVTIEEFFSKMQS
ncbi:MAG: low-specificity L-threonine aldolase [Pseudomonadales bacterium]|nr:low-specificity L-threonine aldolase [Pseudomonadales bacterium]